MKLIRQLVPLAAMLLLAFAISLYAGRAVRASDHQDSPTVVSNPLADITDVFAFPDPKDASKVALVMDVRPLIPGGMYGNIALDPNVRIAHAFCHGLCHLVTKDKRALERTQRRTGTDGGVCA